MEQWDLCKWSGTSHSILVRDPHPYWRGENMLDLVVIINLDASSFSFVYCKIWYVFTRTLHLELNKPFSTFISRNTEISVSVVGLTRPYLGKTYPGMKRYSRPRNIFPYERIKKEVGHCRGRDQLVSPNPE